MNALNYTVRRSQIDKFFHRHISALKKPKLVLDLGGHKVRKRGKFDIGLYELETVYLNLTDHKQPDLLGDAAYIPHPQDCFDIVICAELLEHVQFPTDVLEEAFRVLKPGGQIIITVPFLFRVHGDPHDYGRYTDYYWQMALSNAGFSQISIERQGLFYSVLLDFCKQYSNNMLRRPFRYPAMLIFDVAQKWVQLHEGRARVKAHPFLASYTTGFGIVGVKQ